ncbi:MAG: single-stranded-DNA-specific exonuclease RecJ [Psychroflexus halocasei]|uniref:single-stranded-DNA-specific exonuclease RecJ n=1 Tax=Psychroflexus sp. S27 TaxID=1982757 RepID=UPI000C2B2670|nr:single-stranded-DNA-specific exonuclease RecJ [Psychroflexus sp. S27]PJX22014.1 single-stranded-DNA-specific exonuclease RecJ [Psychroflexus sp. S27]
MKRWTEKKIDNHEVVKQLAESLNVSEEISHLLINRNIKTFDEAKQFFRPQLEDLHDPFLMKDMDVAVKRVISAIENNEKIMVYGDYDVDGTTSVSLMSSYLKTLTDKVISYIPDRYAEGYGVSYQGIDTATEQNIDLIIALDCGIKAVDKVVYAKEKNIDFVICDHHRPGKNLPEAVAVLDPKRDDCHYPYDELCGCGVGFKLAQAIQKKLGLNVRKVYHYLDLVAIAIGSDIVPMTGENRILAYYGLKLVNARKRTGVTALLEQTKRKSFTITDLVFSVGPRINAAGRMRHGLEAVNLLCENNIEKATSFAEEINRHNSDRQETDKKITHEALQQIIDLKEENRFTNVVYHESWHKGVIGIVASRLIETYYKPTLVFTKSGDKLAASARSVTGFDVYNALEECSDLIEQFGGHKYAAGLTLDENNYEAFKNKFESVVKNSIDPDLLVPEIQYEFEIELKNITDKMNRILKQFAPFGPRNMKPTFYASYLKLDPYAKAVGKEGKHLKCKLIQGKVGIGAIGFGLGDILEKISKDDQLEAVFTIEENEWNNEINLQLNIKDIRVMTDS